MKLNPALPGSRRHDDLKHLDKQSGLYVLWRGREVYVGSTHNLRSRLRAHSKRFAGWSFECQLLDITTARYKEAIWIGKYLSKGFRVHNTRLLKAAQRHPSVSRACYHARVENGWDEKRARETPVRGT